MGRLRPALIERLVRYYHVLVEMKAADVSEHFSTEEIGSEVGVDSSQVRKDMARIGIKGRPRVGFEISTVLANISGRLGFDTECPAIIVGSGRLGGALASYPNFGPYGLKLVAAFDIDERRINKRVGDLVVMPLDQLCNVVKENAVELAVITVPAREAQGVADKLVEAGIKAIWNFSSPRVNTPDGVYVRNEHIAVGLGELTHHLRYPEQ